MDWYCPLPFKHAYIDSKGIAACCQTPRYNMSVKQWIDSDKLKNLQDQLLSGKVPSVCNGCVNQEKTQQRSLRTDSITDYNNQVFKETQIDFVDYRASNVCNFKCRSCYPMFSHGIAVETIQNPELQQFFKTPESKVVNISEANIQWVRENITQLKRLMLTGGEPTYMPELRPILEQIIYDELDIDVMITSNASFVDDFWCEFTRKCKRLHWTISLDGVGDVAEIVRHGTKWSTVERNVRWLVHNANSLNFNTVVSNLTVMNLKSLLLFVNEMKRESIYPRGLHGSDGCRHQFHVSQRPYLLAADNWPEELKPKVLDSLKDCAKLDLDNEQATMVTGLIQQISDAKFNKELWQQNTQYNSILDNLRKENYQTLYQ